MCDFVRINAKIKVYSEDLWGFFELNIRPTQNISNDIVA